MKRHIHYLIGLLALIILSGCNNDIFIDNPTVDDDLNAVIDGDGGEAHFTIPTKDLEYISLDVFSDHEKYCHYYNSKGEAISKKSPASEVSRIVFETDYCKFEVLKNGKKITCRSICSTFSANNYEIIRLEYSYGVKNIDIMILPGKPLKLLDIKYDTTLNVTEKATVHTTSTTVDNPGTLPTRIELMPYAGEDASIIVIPEEMDQWVGMRTVTMEVPCFYNGSWVMKEMADIHPGTKAYFSHPECYKTVEVTIPSNSHVIVSTDVIYSQAQADGTFMFKNEILDVTIPVQFTVISLYPVSYDIRIDEAN